MPVLLPATVKQFAAVAAASSSNGDGAAMWLRVTIAASDGGEQVVMGPVSASGDDGEGFTLAVHEADGVPTGAFVAVPDVSAGRGADGAPTYIDVGLIPPVEPPPPPPPPPATDAAEMRRGPEPAAAAAADPLAGIDVGVIASVQQQLLQLILDLNPAVRLSATLRAVGAARDTPGGTGVSPATSKALTAAGHAIGTAHYTFQGRKIGVPAPVLGRGAHAGAPDRSRLGRGGASGASSAAVNPPALLPSVPPPVDADLRQRLCNFYEVHNEFKLPSVAATLRQYAGHEDALFRTLVLQYGPEPTAADLKRMGLLEPLPAGWERVESTRGDVYYRKAADGTRQWKRPRPAAKDADDARRAEFLMGHLL